LEPQIDVREQCRDERQSVIFYNRFFGNKTTLFNSDNIAVSVIVKLPEG